MTVYGRKITDDDMKIICSYMDDEIREKLHGQLAPCTPDEFLEAYLAEDAEFTELLKTEFDWRE